MPNDWEGWRELLNWSTPLAGIIVAVLAIWRICKWLTAKVIEPALAQFLEYFGPQGHFPRYLQVQEDEAKLQSETLKRMLEAFEVYSKQTREDIELIRQISKDNENVHQQISDLLECQRSLAQLIPMIMQHPEESERWQKALLEIEHTVSKWRSR